MSSNNKKSERDPSSSEERDLNKDINKNSQKERFPDSTMTKGSRTDIEKINQKDDSDIEALTDDLAASRSARSTSSAADDIAGVSDLDNGMKRADKR